MAAPAAAQPQPKPYYSSRPLRLLPVEEWEKMDGELRAKIPAAQETEVLVYLLNTLKELPAEKASHIPGNWYWTHAARIFEHWLFYGNSAEEMQSLFPSISHATYLRLIEWWIPKVRRRLFCNSCVQLDGFTEKWLCHGTWQQRVALGKEFFRGPIAGVGTKNPNVSCTLLVRTHLEMSVHPTQGDGTHTCAAAHKHAGAPRGVRDYHSFKTKRAAIATQVRSTIIVDVLNAQLVALANMWWVWRSSCVGAGVTNDLGHINDNARSLIQTFRERDAQGRWAFWDVIITDKVDSTFSTKHRSYEFADVQKSKL